MNIPTAEEFLRKYESERPILQAYTETNEDKMSFYNSAQGVCVVMEVMIEFAKFHVQEALKEALENVPYGSSTDTISYEDVAGILTCYPLENIK